MSAPRCGRNHPMPGWQVVNCGKHAHRLHVCRARVGREPCNQRVLIPELGERCGTPEEVAR